MMTTTSENMPEVRRVPGLDSVDEMINSAVERGRPIFAIPGEGGLSGLAGAQTLAGINLFAYAAERAVPLGLPIYCAICQPVVQPIAQEILKDYYKSAGKEEAYSDEYIPWLSNQQMSFAVGAVGMMTRLKSGFNILVGSFGAEALVIAEAGALVGARQIAACQSTTSTAFFIAACDYVLIGEEIYAASAYLSESPRARASIRGQDIGKIIALALVILGALFATVMGDGTNLVKSLVTF
jgi:hypothetical protein